MLEGVRKIRQEKKIKKNEADAIKEIIFTKVY